MIRKQLYSLRKSTYLSSKIFGKYGENVYSLPTKDGQVPFAFVGNSGVVAWLELDRQFPHMVIDSLKNKRFSPVILKRNLPTQRVILEGNFPEYFNIFYETNNHIITLQILTPDRMAALIDNLRTFNIEIQDNYLRVYVDHAQDSAKDFSKFIEMLDMLESSFKVDRLNRILI